MGFRGFRKKKEKKRNRGRRGEKCMYVSDLLLPRPHTHTLESKEKETQHSKMQGKQSKLVSF